MTCTSIFGQRHIVPEKEPDTGVQHPQNLSGRNFNIGDSVFITRDNCKNVSVIIFHRQSLYFDTVQRITAILPEVKSPFLKIHGNILYSFNYRSYIDTPFAQNDLMQHFLQSNFKILIKDKYPLAVSVSNRSSNSPYFRNTFDVSFRFNQSQLLENIKSELKNNLLHPDSSASQIIQNGLQSKNPEFKLTTLQKLVKPDQISTYQDKLQKEKTRLQALQSWINSTARLQEIVEAKEMLLKSKSIEKKSFSPGQDLFNVIDSMTKVAGYSGASKRSGANKNSLIEFLKNKTAKTPDTLNRVQPLLHAQADLDSARSLLVKLKDSVRQDESKLIQEQKKVRDSLNILGKEIGSLTTGAGLYAFMKKHNMDKSRLSKAQHLLLSVNQLSIGRTWVDYSELTVKNISLAGINIEMNPLPYYLAFAVGKVNYRFRDFIYKKENNLPPQSVALARAGIGQKEKNNFILSFYDGKKSVLNSSLFSTYNATQHIVGFSAESRMSIDANNYLIAEFAKSSYYNNAVQQPSAADLTVKAFNFREHSNEAYSIKLLSQFPSTDTKFSGYFRKMGEHFQSFTLYPLGVNQEAWMARIKQGFWKTKLTLDAAIRKNDFVSPVAAPSFNSQAIFKSFQVTLRVPRYPFVSVGYYPSSQLSLTNNNVLMESQYNTLNATLSHNYLVKKTLSMNTSAVFTKFYNSGTDSGFIYYNACSYSLSHSIFFKGFQTLTGLTITSQQQLDLLTLEQSASFQLKNRISFTGGLKWTRGNHIKNLVGETAGLNFLLKNLGTIQLHYEKTYLPGYNRELRPVDTGNLSFYKEF